MTFDEDSAELFIESETEWKSEPELSAAQRDFLLEAAKATTSPVTYTIASIGAVIYLGISWKLKRAIEYHEGDESKIFDHLKELMERWAIYADPDLGLPASSLQLVEIEVGANFV